MRTYVDSQIGFGQKLKCIGRLSVFDESRRIIQQEVDDVVVIF